MSCSVCPRRRGSRVEHSGRQAGRQRARSPLVARGVRPGARPARPGRGGTRRRAGRHRAVAPARAAGREGGLGHVGEITEVRVALLESFLLAGLTPVIAPMAPDASGVEGPPLNVNADDAAAAVAGALRAAELLLVSDVPGVEVDGAVRSALEAGDVETLIELGVAADGMAAKLRAATAALGAGARAVRIGDLRLLDDARAGTRILAPAVQPA